MILKTFFFQLNLLSDKKIKNKMKVKKNNEKEIANAEFS